ncbi:MAG: hypothetical protein KKA05_10270 [Alphaproteobacteria bacterium]|nr:hypothetical protein [Alphaproteobacteria bacterium]
MASSETLRTEAALCIWEWMQENRDGPSPASRAIEARWQRLGTVEMRHAAIQLAPWVLAVWDALDDDTRDSLAPYDWEGVPRILAHVDWEGWQTPLSSLVARQLRREERRTGPGYTPRESWRGVWQSVRLAMGTTQAPPTGIHAKAIAAYQARELAKG